MIEEVRRLNKEGDSKGALAVLDSIQAKDRYHYYEAAKAHMALKDYDGAISNIDKVLKIKGEWVGACGIKITGLYNKKKFDAIAPCLIDLINNSVKLTDRGQSYPVIFNAMLDYKIPGILTLLDSILEYYKFKLGEDDVYNFYKGITNSNSEKLDFASKNFRKVKDLATFGRHSTGAASFAYGDRLTVILADSSYDNLPSVQFSGKKIAPSEYDATLLASCDNGYFDIFIDLIVASISKKLKRKVFHIHLINPSSETLDRCVKLSANHTLFNYSFEHIPDAQKLEFACSRFVRLEDFLSYYEKDVMVCDMDSCFVDDFSTSYLLDENDVAVKYDNKCRLHLYPWRQYIASFVVFKNNEATMRLATSMRKFLMHFIDKKDADYWYVDQTALFCLLEMHKHNFALKYKLIDKTSNIVLVPEAVKESKQEFVKRLISTM